MIGIGKDNHVLSGVDGLLLPSVTDSQGLRAGMLGSKCAKLVLISTAARINLQLEVRDNNEVVRLRPRGNGSQAGIRLGL
jgi:hypothetical protein